MGWSRIRSISAINFWAAIAWLRTWRPRSVNRIPRAYLSSKGSGNWLSKWAMLRPAVGCDMPNLRAAADSDPSWATAINTGISDQSIADPFKFEYQVCTFWQLPIHKIYHTVRLWKQVH